MTHDTLQYGFDHPTSPVAPVHDGWGREVREHLARHHWAMAELHGRLDLGAWQGFTADLPRDPYVNRRWKRMSWLTLDAAGRVREPGLCPMAQGGAFNDADSMADRLRYYEPLTPAFLARDDVTAFVRAWAGLWGIGPDEPILMQITGVRGEGRVDPLQGQGIHADGCQALSILVLSRDNVLGADSHLYADKAGTRPRATACLRPGEILHLRDDRLFHAVDPVGQLDPMRPFERFIVIINARFVDDFQNRILRRHFPHATLWGKGEA